MFVFASLCGSLIIVSKAEAQVLPSRVGSWFYSQILDHADKLAGTNAQASPVRKKFNKIDTSSSS